VVWCDDVEAVKSHLEELKRLQSDFNDIEEGFISMVAVESPLNLWENNLFFQDTVKFEIDLLSSENTQVVTKVLSLLFASNEDC